MGIKVIKLLDVKKNKKIIQGFGWPLHNLTAGKYFLQKQDKIPERQ